MVKFLCDKCTRLEEAAALSCVAPDVVHGVVIKCEMENSFCLYCQSRIYFTKARNRNKERVVKKYLEKEF